MATRRTWGALALAVLFHGLALFGMARVAPFVTERHSPSPASTDLEVFLDTETPSVSRIVVPKEQRESRAPTGARSQSSNLTQDAPVAEPEPAQVANPADAALNTEAVTVSPELAAREPLTLKDLGIGQSNLWVVGPELARRGSNREPVPARQASARAAGTRLNESLARGLIESDKLGTTQAEGAIKVALRAAASDLLLTSTSTVVQIWLGADGTVSKVALLSTDHDQAKWLAALERLKGTGTTGSRAAGGNRPMVLTYELRSNVRLPSGRSPGTGVSLSRVPVKNKGAADSAEIKVIPHEYALKRALMLDPEKSGALKQDTSPESRVYLEATVLEANLDPADVAGTAQHAVQIRLLRREVL